MKSTPTVPVPVTGISEVETENGDTLCVHAVGKTGWSVQIVRNLKRRRASMCILRKSVDNLEQLESLVNECLSGDYGQLEENLSTKSQSRYAWVGVIGMFFVYGLALIFLGFVISFFLKLEWT